MGTVYRPGDYPARNAPSPAGLALGDAWFWHGEQTLLQALVDHPRLIQRPIITADDGTTVVGRDPESLAKVLR